MYLRAGYSPTDYPTEAEWDGRLTIESSNAAKCVRCSVHCMPIASVCLSPVKLEVVAHQMVR